MRPEERQVRFRARPEARKRWEGAAELRGETLSEFLRIAAEERTSRQPEEEVAAASVSPPTSPARAKTHEDRLAGIKAIVDGLGSQPVPGFPNRRSSAPTQVKPGVSTATFYRETPRAARLSVCLQAQRGG